MNTLEKHNKEMEEKFDEVGGEEILDTYTDKLPDGHLTRGFDFPESARELDPDKVKSFITSQNKSLLKKIAEGEIERLVKETQPFKVSENMDERQAWNDAIESQLTHWQQVLEDLER